MYNCKTQLIKTNAYRVEIRGRDSSIGKSSASQSGDPGSNPSGGLTQVTQCIN